MTMKKILPLAIALSMSAACLVACGGSDDSSNDKSTSSKSETVSATDDSKANTDNSKSSDAPSSAPENDSSVAEQTTDNHLEQMENAALQYPSQNDEWKYNVYDCYIELTEYIGEDKQELIVPDEIDGLPVWTIDCPIGSSITTSVQLPKELLVCDGLSGCKSLESIEIPNGVIEIGESAFANCTSLKSVKLPDTLVTIGRYAFSDCIALESIDLPEGLETIGFEAFAFSGLTTLTIPTTVKEIGVNSEAISQGREPDPSKFAELKVLNPDCKFTSKIFTCKNEKDLVIYGYAGSTAAQYAADHDYTFKLIEE